MKNNPWNDMKPDEYDLHMSHPDVWQTQTLNGIIKEQLGLAPINSDIAILGITNGNGLEHAETRKIGRIIGIDINRSFLDECGARYPLPAEKLTLCQIDLISEKSRAAEILADCGLIIANLLIEHIHLDNFIELIGKLPDNKRIISCVIQRNPDGSLSSASGAERAFDAVVDNMEEADEGEIASAMKNAGYALQNRAEYGLPNKKIFVRLDYAAE